MSPCLSAGTRSRLTLVGYKGRVCVGSEPKISQHLVEPHSSGANGTGDPAILARDTTPGDALCACWRMIFAPQDRMVDVDVGSTVKNCAEEHDTCLTTAITSSQHLRGAAKPISTHYSSGKTPTHPRNSLLQRCLLLPKDCLHAHGMFSRQLRMLRPIIILIAHASSKTSERLC